MTKISLAGLLPALILLCSGSNAQIFPPMMTNTLEELFNACMEGNEVKKIIGPEEQKAFCEAEALEHSTLTRAEEASGTFLLTSLFLAQGQGIASGSAWQAKCFTPITGHRRKVFSCSDQDMHLAENQAEHFLWSSTVGCPKERLCPDYLSSESDLLLSMSRFLRSSTRICRNPVTDSCAKKALTDKEIEERAHQILAEAQAAKDKACKEGRIRDEAYCNRKLSF